MNRILIVGHPSSGYREVEEILQQRGMASPHPSRHEALLPQGITATLCKIHQVPDIGSVTCEAEIKPLQVAPVWHGMALDLMLSNLDQKLWGWSDPQSIYLLDYWCQLDDCLTFILVYDEPQLALLNAVSNEKHFLNTTIEHHINNWMAYNGSLLTFFLRNRHRCLLVSSQQVKRNAEACLQQLQLLLSTPLLSSAESKSVKGVFVSSDDNNKNLTSTVNPMLFEDKRIEIATLAGLDNNEIHNILQGNTVENYILDQMLYGFPDCQHLYAELQSVASLPMQTDFNEILNPGIALEKIIQQRLLNEDLTAGLYHAYLSMKKMFEQSVENNSHEVEMLFSQLHQVQDELERFFLENQKLKQQQSPAWHGAAERIKQELSYRLGATMIKHSHSLGGWLGIPKALAAERRAWREQNSTQPQNNLPPISLYRDAHEAERVKNHLSYRLGQAFISTEGSLFRWIKLPFILHRSVRQYRYQRKGQ